MKDQQPTGTIFYMEGFALNIGGSHGTFTCFIVCFVSMGIMCCFVHGYTGQLINFITRHCGCQLIAKNQIAGDIQTKDFLQPSLE